MGLLSYVSCHLMEHSHMGDVEACCFVGHVILKGMPSYGSVVIRVMWSYGACHHMKDVVSCGL